MPENLSSDVELLYRRLLIADLRHQLPGVPVDEGSVPTDSELGRLMSVASRLALSDDPADKTIAYEVATRVVEIRQDAVPAFLAGAELILMRLGNFPGRQLLRGRYLALRRAASLTPRFLVLEAMARETENTVTSLGGEPVQLTDFQCELLDVLGKSKAVSMSAPTSAGKSFVLSLEIVRRLKSALPSSIAYVVPTRALIRQVMLKIVADLNASGLGRVPVRCAPLPLSRDKSPLGVVYVLTQERLISLLQSDVDEAWITTLIVDEAQGIADDARGIILQTAIDLATARFPSIEVFFASPMAKNPEYLLRLFDMDQQGKSLVEEHSPVSQNLILVSGVKRNPRNASFQLLTSGGPLDLGTRRLNFNFNEGVMARRARFAKAVTPEEDCTIVYANDPSDAEQLARLLAQGEPEPEELEEDIVELIEFLREEVHPQYELIETLKHRVAFHYGFMPGIVRARVEDLFKGSKLRFICCTSTLLQGVNLPARNIIIENPRRGRGNPMDRAAFLNLAGRAGRLLKEFHGNVWCLKPEKWDNACYEGARLQEMSSAFALTLEDGGSLIRQAVDGTVTQDQMDLATTALGKVFTEFTQEGKRLENSKYRSGDNAEDLRETSDLCARIRTDLPREVFRRNFTILPMRLQELYQHLKRRPDIASCIPPLPHRPGFYERMTFIFQILDLTLSKIENQSHKFHAWLAYNWIHDMPLREMIEVRIQFLRIKGRFISVGVTIAELMKALENDIRHRYVKHLRAYNDVLAFVLREAGRDDLAADLKPLHLFIECGASDPVVLSLITIGLSRTTALLLKGKVRFTEGESPEDCLARLSATNLSSLNIPALCRKEIEEILRS